MKKYLFPLAILTAFTVSCGRNDSSRTDDGQRADGQVQTGNFENNPPVNEQAGESNKKSHSAPSETSASTPVTSAPALPEVTGNPAVRTADMAPQAAPEITASSRSEGNVVRRVQDELNRRGVKAPRNGYLGDETKMAIKNFQRAEGLEPTGHLTETTLKALGIPVTHDNREPASVKE